MFCREQAVQLHRERAAIRKRGAELAFIGNGNRHFAEAFKKEFAIEAPLYVDTKRDAYKPLEMKRSVGATIAFLDTWKSGLRALKASFRQGSVRGDAWQLGGVVVVKPLPERQRRRPPTRGGRAGRAAGPRGLTFRLTSDRLAWCGWDARGRILHGRIAERPSDSTLFAT